MKKILKIFLTKFKIGYKILIIYRKIKLLFYSYFKLPKIVKVPINGDFIILNTRNWATTNVCQYFFKNGILDYEPNQRKIFIFLSKFSKVVFDLGTQIGIYAILAAKSGSFKIYAFDIDKSFLEIAKKHAINNNVLNKIDFIEAAIGENENDYIEIENFSGISKLKSFSLDYFCKAKNIWPDLIKIDIEGYELECFKGASNVLLKKPIIIFSLHSSFLIQRDRNPKEIFEILFDNKYIIFDLTDKIGKIVDYTNINLYLNDKIVDFICVPQDHLKLKEVINYIKKYE